MADKNGDGILDVTDTYDGDGKDYNDNLNDFDVIMVDTNGDGYAESELERTIPTISLTMRYLPIPPIPTIPPLRSLTMTAVWADTKLPMHILLKMQTEITGSILTMTAPATLRSVEDIDGDGKLEGVADKDGDGILTVNDSYDNDNVDYNGNPNAYDVIMVDKDGDGTAETELEKPEPTAPEVPLYDNT